jgi:hypothetical protein
MKRQESEAVPVVFVLHRYNARTARWARSHIWATFGVPAGQPFGL